MKQSSGDHRGVRAARGVHEDQRRWRRRRARRRRRGGPAQQLHDPAHAAHRRHAGHHVAQPAPRHRASLGNMSQLTMAYLVRYDAQQPAGPRARDRGPDAGQRRHQQRRPDDHVALAQGREVVRRRAVRRRRRRVVDQRGQQPGQQRGRARRLGPDHEDRRARQVHRRLSSQASRTRGFLPTFFGSAGANPCILPKHLLGDAAELQQRATTTASPSGSGRSATSNGSAATASSWRPTRTTGAGCRSSRRSSYRFIPDRNTLLTQLQTGEVDLWPYVGAGYYDRVKALPNAHASRAARAITTRTSTSTRSTRPFSDPRGAARARVRDRSRDDPQESQPRHRHAVGDAAHAGLADAHRSPAARRSTSRRRTRCSTRPAGCAAPTACAARTACGSRCSSCRTPARPTPTS